jgi:hypothetical protein
LSKEVLFSPFPKQEEFLASALSGEFDFVLFGGAIRGGKTFALLGLFIFLAKMHPRSRWAIVRKDLNVIRKNTYPSWEKIKPINFVQKHDKDLHEVTFTNGSKLIFFAENYAIDKDLNRWRGLEVNGIGFEEMNECTELSFYKAFERAGAYVIPNTKNQPKPLVVGTCNPARGYVKDLIYDPWKKGTLKPNWKYIQSRIYDNKPLLEAQPGLIQQYKANMPTYQFMQFVEGDWDVQVKTGGEAYKCFEIDKHIGDVDYNPSQPLHISFDENVNPYLPCGVFQIEGTQIKWISEIASKTPRNNINGICSEIKRLYPNHKSGVFIYGDATSKKQDTKLEHGHNFFRLIMDELKDYRPQLRVQSANPSVVMRLNWINTWFEKETDGMTLIIDRDCKHAIDDFILTKEAADGTKNKEMETDPMTKVRYQVHGHFSDLFDYFVTTAFATNYQRYQQGSIARSVSGGRRKYAKNSY